MIAFEVLLDKGEVDRDVVLLIDEMHLQESRQYDGKVDERLTANTIKEFFVL